VQVHRDEGLANHIGPESCASAREGDGEALTGEEHAGQPSSPVMAIVPDADALIIAEGNISRRAIASAAIIWRGRMQRLAGDWLPKPKTLHPWPAQRFAARHSRQEPCAGIPPARICAGGGEQSPSLPRSLRPTWYQFGNWPFSTGLFRPLSDLCEGG